MEESQSTDLLDMWFKWFKYWSKMTPGFLTVLLEVKLMPSREIKLLRIEFMNCSEQKKYHFSFSKI